MNTYQIFLIEVIASFAMSIAVLCVLSKTLVQVLIRICPDKEAVGFWVSYTKIMLIIAPVLLVLIMGLFAEYEEPIKHLRLTFISILGGLLISLYLIGTRINKFVNNPKPTGEVK